MTKIQKFNEDQFKDFISDFLDKSSYNWEISEKTHPSLGSLVVRILRSDFTFLIHYALTGPDQIGDSDLKSGLHRFEKYFGYEIYGWSTYLVAGSIIGYQVGFNTN